MSLYRMNDDNKLLEKFFHEAQGKGERDLTTNEKAFIRYLRGLINDGYRLGRTIRGYMVMLRRMGNDYNDVISNLYYAQNSIDKQSGLGVRIKEAMMVCKPDKKTVEAINRYCKKFKDRQSWLVKTSIGAAIDLTFVKEYIELVGEEEFEKELRFALKDDKEEFGTMGQFCELMLRKVTAAGLQDEYKARMDRYMGRVNEIRSISDEDRAKEKAEAEEQSRNDCETLTYKCTSKLYDCIEQLKENRDIGFILQSYCKKRDKCTEPSGVVVVGKFHGNKFLFRYLRALDEVGGKTKIYLGDTIGTATVFGVSEAEEKAKWFMDGHPREFAMAVRIV